MFIIKSIRNLVFFIDSKIILLFLLFASGCTTNNKEEDSSSKQSYILKENTTSQTIYSHRYSKNYNVVYPASNKLFYSKIESIVSESDQDSVTINFYFKNTYPNFKKYIFKVNDTSHSTSNKEFFSLKFNKNSTENIYKILIIEVITTDNKSHQYSINTSYDSKTINQKNGRASTNNSFYIHETDVSFMGITSDKFLEFTPSKEEKRAAQKEFGACLKNITSERKRINLLAKTILDALEDKRGIPSDSMNTLTPIQQYQRVMNNQDKVWCGNISLLFAYVCSCFDIPARLIGLGNKYTANSYPVIYHSGSHTLTEIYNTTTNKWQVMDLTFYMLEATSDEGELLNFIDFWYLMNMPKEREKILISSYDARKQKINKIPVTRSKKFTIFMGFYKKNQKSCFPFKGKDGRAYFNF